MAQKWRCLGQLVQAVSDLWDEQSGVDPCPAGGRGHNRWGPHRRGRQFSRGLWGSPPQYRVDGLQPGPQMASSLCPVLGLVPDAIGIGVRVALVRRGHDRHVLTGVLAVPAVIAALLVHQLFAWRTGGTMVFQLSLVLAGGLGLWVFRVLACVTLPRKRRSHLDQMEASRSTER